MKEEHVVIDASLVRRLIASQFSQWKELSIDPVATSGWDNRTFCLPSAERYAAKVLIEHKWLLRPRH